MGGGGGLRGGRTMSSSPLKEPFKLAYVGYCPHPETVHIRGHIKVCICTYVYTYIYIFFLFILSNCYRVGAVSKVYGQIRHSSPGTSNSPNRTNLLSSTST